MGFEILPIEDDDEKKYKTITITSPKRWTPHQFLQEESKDPYFYDPTDKAFDENAPLLKIDNDENSLNADGYPSQALHTSQVYQEDQVTMLKHDFGSVNSSKPMVETQIYAMSTWHRIIHQDIDPKLLRTYLGWRPLVVVKEHFKEQLNLQE